MEGFRVRAAGALVLALLATACQKDADEELQKSVRSWRSTLELVQREEAKHDVSAKYVKQVAELASKSLEKEIKNPDVKAETRRDAEKVVEAANKISGGGK
jgi:translation initiation factor 2B subunit (eIF-2B alpha/beta/delta family)